MSQINDAVDSGRTRTSAQPAPRLAALPRIIWIAFGLLTIITIAATFYESADRVAPNRPGLTIAVGCAGALFGLLVAWLAARFGPWLARTADWLDALPAGVALAVIIVCGIAARLAVTAILGAVVTSDGTVYVGLASRLVEGKEYIDPSGDLAYWPPGYPFLLAGAGLVFDLSRPVAAIVAVNLLSFFLATVGAYLLGRWLYSRAAGLAAAALVAVWPNLIIGISGANKEFPALGLLTMAILLYVWARRRNHGRIDGGNLAAAFGSGLALGMASLVQPALMFLPTALLLAEIVESDALRQSAARLLLAIAGILVVVTPWSMRNSEQLGATVSIATNGGDVLYRANNPRAVPGYLAEGPVDLRQYPEVERSRLGFRLALEWIAEEPHRFLVLSWKRLLHFSGDNSSSAFDAFRRNEDGLQPRYVALKAVSNAAWLALWLLMLVALTRGSIQSAATPGAWLLVLSYLYVACMDSIAESGARHHVPFAGVLAVLAASALRSPRTESAAAAGGERHAMGQFVDFAVVGAVGTAAHFVTLILLVQSAGWTPALATTAGFLVGALINYGLNYRLTFQSRASHAVTMPRFLAIALLSMLLNIGIVGVLVHWNAMHYLLGQAVATLVVLVVNFVANRALTFTASQPG